MTRGGLTEECVTQDGPDGADLLSEARTLLLQEILPRLPEDQRYNALMVAGAMAIALRELAAGSEAPGAVPHPGAAALAAAIRRGDHDGDPEVHDRLRRDAVARLRLANPKALPSGDAS